MRASIYCRISRDREGAGLGVATQEADCRELAATLGWSVVSVHTDNDISAYSGRKRPGYDRLLAEVEAGQIDAVIAWHTDRLHRSLVELEQYVAVSETAGVTTQTVKAGHIDLATPSGRLVARQLGAVARYEVEHSIERNRRAKRRSAEAGLYRGGPRPYGFEADGVTVRESEAVHVRAATTDLLAGVSLGSIVRDWNGAGRLTSKGCAWTPVTVVQVLTRPRNAGLIDHKGEIVGRAGWDPLVPEEQWRALVEFLADPGRVRNGGRWRVQWLGSGIYRCQCGTAMLSANQNGGRAYKCRSCYTVRKQAPVDVYVEAVVVERLRRSDFAGLLGTEGPSTALLERQAVELRSRLDSLAGMFADGTVDARQLTEGTRTVNARLDQVHAELAVAYRGSALDGIATAADPGQRWLDSPMGRKRAVLDALLTVTIMRVGKGRPAGWRPGGDYFRPDSLQLQWK